MKIITLEEQKNLELEILLYVDDICKKNNISYSICGGTLLGAIRHKGFIPWDDDIDIFLIRPEYERLINILEKEEKYHLISEDTVDYYYTFAKLVNKDTVIKNSRIKGEKIPNLGVYIDIFPVNGLPDTHDEQIKYTRELHQDIVDLRDSLDNYYSADKIWKYLPKIILRYPRHRKALKKGSPEEQRKAVVKKASEYPFETSKYAGFVLSAYAEKEILPVEVFKETMDIEFEGHMVRCIKNYDIWLKSLFGNYMELPPEKKRVSHHPYIAYWKDV
ncbi:MAG: LicD family protein [Lachnospiraceae bacterium]|nr:LicD family protein [Lachnospiraceae bacterium]